MNFLLVMYDGAVQYFHFHGLILNKLETPGIRSFSRPPRSRLHNIPLSKLLIQQTTCFGIDLILQAFENILQFYFNLKITPNHLPLVTHSWAAVQNVAYCQENN